MSEKTQNRAQVKEQLKKLLLELHKGKNVNEVKNQFKSLLRSINPLEIPIIEQELIKDGISPWEIVRMCDVHVELFREAVAEREEFKDLLPGHPLHTLLMENEQIVRDSEVLSLYANALVKTKDEGKRKEILDYLRHMIFELAKVGNHYAREEMLIFPYLEKRGITAVPTVLWAKHDEIRFKIRTVRILLTSEIDNWDEFVKELKEKIDDLARALVDMVFREDNILYPTIKELFSEGEWVAIRNEESEIGYYKVTPGDEWKPSAKPILPYQVSLEVTPEQAQKVPREVQMILKSQKVEKDTYQVEREGDLALESGYLSLKEVNAIFKMLPFDVTFVDKDDRVRFFSRGKERIFPRATTVLGRPVKYCHPPRSVGVVEEILKSFKEGQRDVAEFWIQMGGRFVHIRYFAVRDESGEYLGTLEVVQDATEIRKLEGEKRLLDWK